MVQWVPGWHLGLWVRNGFLWFLRPACMVGPLQPALVVLGCMPNSALPRCVLLVPSAWFLTRNCLVYILVTIVAVVPVGHIPRISALVGQPSPRVILARVGAVRLLGVVLALVNDCAQGC